MSHRQDSTLITLSQLKATRLDNEREAYIYLPASYHQRPEQHYPVLYMHVGQHVFEPTKDNGEAWRMHEVLDRLIGDQLIDEILLVAIEHKYEDGKSEYFHERSAYPVKCVGDQYEHFLVHELKPCIDRLFRTLPGPDHTALMGSSAAGIATYNIGLRNPEVFGMLGMLSPFFVQVDPATLAETKQYRLYEEAHPKQKLWLDIGGMEGFFMPRHVKEVALALQSIGYSQGEQLYYLEEPHAAHTEPDWGSRAHMPLLHFFGRPAKAVSVQLHGAETIGIAGPLCHLNPLVTIANGLSYTDLTGDYEVSHPELLAISADGTLRPLAPGTAEVRYRCGTLQASKTIHIVEALSGTVILNIEIEVPSATPDEPFIYATFPVPKLRQGLYGGKIPIPRGLGFVFQISRGYDLHEMEGPGQPVPPRTIIADRDQTVRYHVQCWSDQLAAASGSGGQ